MAMFLTLATSDFIEDTEPVLVYCEKCEIAEQVTRFVANTLDTCEFWYIASPYSSDKPEIEQKRVEAVSAIVAKIFKEHPNVFPFAPIPYTHEHAEVLSPTEWYQRDLIVLARLMPGGVDKLVVVPIEGMGRESRCADGNRICEEVGHSDRILCGVRGETDVEEYHRKHQDC